MPPAIDYLLAQRSQQYHPHGCFDDVARTSGTIRTAVFAGKSHLSFAMQEAVMMIANKLARVAHGNPNNPDHWADIAGYATLVAEQLEAEQGEAEQ